MKAKSKKQVQHDSDEVEENQLKKDYVIKPSNEQPKTDSSQWPFLLKVPKNILIVISIEL